MAILFDGIDDKVNCGSTPSIENLWAGGATFMAWINPTGWGEGGFGRIASKGDSDPDFETWLVMLDDNTATGSLGFYHQHNTSQGQWYTANNSITLDTIQHIAVVYNKDSTTNDPSFYINGVLIGATELSTPVGGEWIDNNEPLVLGNRVYSTDRTFDGSLADVRYYDREVPQDEILTIVQAKGKDGIIDGLKARWLMKELEDSATASGADIVKDITGNGNDGTPANKPTYIADELSMRRNV